MLICFLHNFCTLHALQGVNFGEHRTRGLSILVPAAPLNVRGGRAAYCRTKASVSAIIWSELVA